MAGRLYVRQLYVRQLYVDGRLYVAEWHIVARRLCVAGRRVGWTGRLLLAERMYMAGGCT